MKNEIDRIMQTAYVEGTTTEYELVTAKLHAFEPNDKILWLWDEINRVAQEDGFGAFGKITLGGASDTGAVARADIPVLCSCGVIGEFNHNIREYAVVQSMFDRAKIFTDAAVEISGFDK